MVRLVKLIVIDPGHGGNDPGARGLGLQEKDITLELGLRVKEILGNYADVRMTRVDDTFVSPSARADFANKVGADFFLSIHVNAGGGTGFESFIHPNASQQAISIREAFHKEISGFYLSKGFIDRGMKTANFAVVRETLMPAVLTENLFIDKREDAVSLKSATFRTAAAKAIANGVIRALNLHETTMPTPTPTSLPTTSPTAAPTTAPTPAHWAQPYFDSLVKAGLVNDPHDLAGGVNWGDLSVVISRLLDKLEGK